MMPTVYKGSDRWYYTAVLTNPKSGDVAEQPARFLDQRTVPLIEDTSGYCAALNKLTIQGAAANLPVLIAPVQRVTPASDPAVIYTEYFVGVRYIATNPVYPAEYAISDMQIAQLRIPSTYPLDNRSDATSKFYWVTSQQDVVTAINTALADAFSADPVNRVVKWKGYGGTNILTGGASQTMTAPLDGFTSGGGVDTGYSPYTLALAENDTSGLKKVKAVSTSPGALYPSEGVLVGSNAAFNAATRADTGVAAYVYFNDKLLEAVPFDTLFDVFADNSAASFPVPWLEKLPMAQFNSTDRETVTSTLPFVPLGYGASTVSITGYMYPLAWTRRHAIASIFTDATTSITGKYVRPAEWYQENAATSNWGYYTGIAIASGILPAFPTSIGVNTADPSGRIGSDAQTASNSIIFEADLPNPGQQLYGLQNGVEFKPENLQWQRLKPGVRLTSMDLSLYLRTRNGQYVPWMITNGGTVTVQLVFSTDPW